MHFDSFLASIGLRHGGDADERVALNVGHRALGGGDDGGAVLERNIRFLSTLARNDQIIAVNLFKCAAHPGRCVFRKRSDASLVAGYAANTRTTVESFLLGDIYSSLSFAHLLARYETRMLACVRSQLLDHVT